MALDFSEGSTTGAAESDVCDTVPSSVDVELAVPVTGLISEYDGGFTFSN